MIAGFDPGKKGALVLMDTTSFRLDVHRVPLEKWTEKHRKKADTHKSEIDWPELTRDWGAALLNVTHIFIENVWGAAPAGKGRKDGGASMFKMGYAAGVPFGIVLSMGVPYTFITPQKWHKMLDYPKVKEGENPKAPSFDFARRFFPEQKDEFKRVTVDEGVAEAALIAYVGRLLLEQGNADHS